MRTIVYVDGFNLYYSSLKGTPYKWLNLKALMQALLAGHNEIVGIKYFTARVSATQSDPHKADHQDAYIRALRRTTPELSIYFGQFTTHQVKAKLAIPIAGQNSALVIRTSEKGSDVNLAVHLLNDAWMEQYDCAVVVSRDSDLAEAIKLVKEHHPQKVVGVMAARGNGKGIPKELAQHANFVKPISEWALKQSLFPDVIPGTSIKKPRDW